MPRYWRCCWLLLCLTRIARADPDPSTLRWMQTVVDRWEQTCRHHLNLSPEPLPWIVFYDDRHAWHVNPEPDLLPPYKRLRPSLRYLGHRYPLYELETAPRGLWLPDGDVLPVHAEGVTKPYARRKLYVQMAAPSLWWKEYGRDHVPLEHLYSEALHELTHTRQFLQLMEQVNSVRSRYHFPSGLDDDIIEHTFGANEEYKRMYDHEREQLMRAIAAPDLVTCRQATITLLRMVKSRQQQFFRGEFEGWAVLEDLFLTLEGSALWVQAQMALDHAPSGQTPTQTLLSLVPFYGQWSQEEGLGLLLLIDRLDQAWKPRFFGSALPSPFETLRTAVENTDLDNQRGK